MINNPSAIDDIADAEQIRVLFYASNRIVHAPLNKVLDLVKSDIQHDLLSAFAEYKEVTDKRIETMQKLINELQSHISQNPKNRFTKE
ncbi:hypothetical protein [Bartonella sp. ML70XJBT.G]|uniref:hypothetical protein n=1 Tax=Bartonella sp. ML70XJBT.G TaxID=3019093 RepID=UPI002360BC6F|nr:hypothetical protein [Bartonella sp. ML70XJBT.G]